MTTDDTLATLRLAAAAAADKKAFRLLGLDVEGLTSYADAFLICSAGSDRHVGAVVEGIRERLRASGRRPLHVEGDHRSEWVLMDFGDLVVHVFTEERRDYYALDGLWGDARRLDADALGLEDR